MDQSDFTYFINRDGEPWAIFCNGHLPLGEFTDVSLVLSLTGEDFDGIKLSKDGFVHGWIRESDDDELDQDYNYVRCQPDSIGAVPVTILWLGDNA